MRSTVKQCLLPKRALVLSLTERESLTVVLLVSEVIARPEFYLDYKRPPNTAGMHQTTALLRLHHHSSLWM